MKSDTHHVSVGRLPQLILALLLVTAFLSVPVTARADSGHGAPPADAPGDRVAAEENDHALKYWTEERMKNSRAASPEVRGQGRSTKEPTDKGRPAEVPPEAPTPGAKKEAPGNPNTEQAQPTTGTVAANSTATSASEGYWQGANTANPNAQIGRLFYNQWDPITKTWLDYNCSGTVVNSENKVVVWTAGHCVFQTYSNVWNTNYMFCPGYRNGSCPLGRWTPYSQSTTVQWQNSACTADGRCTPSEFQYDFGALKMNAINGYRIGNWVGSHGISFNGPTYQHRYLFGYPLNKASGHYLYYCSGNNTYTYGNLRMTPCTAGPGASGGPWLSQINSSWLGVVHSVNSHGDTSYMAGPYQGNVAQNLFSTVRY